MEKRYGIRVVCSNPKCGEAFFITTDEERKTPLAFSKIMEAFVYCDGLGRGSPSGGFAARY